VRLPETRMSKRQSVAPGEPSSLTTLWSASTAPLWHGSAVPCSRRRPTGLERKDRDEIIPNHLTPGPVAGSAYQVRSLSGRSSAVPVSLAPRPASGVSSSTREAFLNLCQVSVTGLPCFQRSGLGELYQSPQRHHNRLPNDRGVQFEQPSFCGVIGFDGRW